MIESFIQEKLRRIEEQNRTLDQILTTNSVTLKKRLRDMTREDMFGVFNQKGVWKSLRPQNVHSLNIIKSAVKTTEGAVTSASPKVTIEPRFPKDVEAEMAAQVANAIKDLKSEEQWTPQLIEMLALEPQVAPGIFLSVEWDEKAKKKYSIDQWGDEEFPSGGKAVCKSCGYESEASVIGASTVPCEHCGEEAEIVEEPQMETMPVMSGLEFVKGGDTVTKIIPACEIVMDDRGTQGGNIKNARWMLHRHLEPIDEVRMEYPNCPGGSLDWSYPLKWQHTVSTGRENIGSSDNFDDLVEVKDLYLTPQAYGHVKGQEFILKDDEGIRFYVPKEGLLNAVFQGEQFDEPPVLCFRTMGGTLVDVFPMDFREMVYVSLMASPSSFWGMFLTEMIPLQNVVNYMFTLQVEHTKRNARTTKVLNSGSFDPEDVEKDVVLTKDPLPYDVPISNTFDSIPAATLSTAPMELVQLIFTTKGDIGGITPAMQGQSSPSEPYAAQRQQKEQSMGQLTPFLRSIATGKVQWSLRQIKEAQENWSEEDFQYLLKLNSEWTEEHIDAFLKANLDTDIIIDYEQGSESPRNLYERELALRQFMQDVGMLAALDPTIATPELVSDILLRLKQFTQVDVDVNNVEAELRLADARFDKIKALVGNEKLPPDTPPEVYKLMAMQLVSLPDLMPSPYEDPTSQVTFYQDKIQQELAQDEPNFLLVACCEAMIGSFEQMAMDAALKQTEMQMQAQAPMIEQQKQMADEQAAGEEDAQRKERLAQEGQAMAQQTNEKASKQEDAEVRKQEREHAHELKMKEIKESAKVSKASTRKG